MNAEHKDRGAIAQLGWKAFGPFDSRHTLAKQILLEIFEQLSFDAIQSIQVDVVQPETTAVLRFDDERRARNWSLYSQPPRQALHERRFTRAEGAFEQITVTRPRDRPQGIAESAHCVWRWHLEFERRQVVVASRTLWG